MGGIDDALETDIHGIVLFLDAILALQEGQLHIKMLY